jgi:hypothetical protein
MIFLTNDCTLCCVNFPNPDSRKYIQSLPQLTALTALGADPQSQPRARNNYSLKPCSRQLARDSKRSYRIRS